MIAARLAPAFALALAAGTAGAAQPGYLSTARDTVVRSGYGLCWHTSQWSRDKAIAVCDPLSMPKTAALPVVEKPRSEPPRPAAPAPVAAPAPKPAPLERLTLESELLFDFDSANLRASGREKLDELALKLHGARIDRIEAVGYADRIASKAYNQALSERRAKAVEDYLEARGIDARSVHTEGRGEADPVTGDQCRHMGPENRTNAKLVACLQPDRRVEIEVYGARKVARLGGTGS